MAKKQKIRAVKAWALPLMDKIEIGAIWPSKSSAWEYERTGDPRVYSKRELFKLLVPVTITPRKKGGR